ncbi:MAG: DnaJ domain-containing protein, partial [Anaerolineales bacterium]|nr:DnaJ domain-containing protein [Anaerolineales bacterium]
MPDPYAVLGVPAAATEAQIRAAYRRLAARVHP